MPKLTDTQLAILFAATARADNSILPLPEKLKLSKHAANSLLENLVKKRLAKMQPAAAGALVWRSDKVGQPMMLIITETGQRALVTGSADFQRVASASVSKNEKPSRREVSSIPLQKATRKPTSHKTEKAGRSTGPSGSKQEKGVGLLRRAGGTTIKEMMKTTGWQAHSVRGVISGALRKKRALAIISEKSKTGDRRYRIAK